MNASRFFIYALRWQLSTPLLWLVVRQFGTGFWATVLANFVGSCIFYWVDRFIFGAKVQEWEFLSFGACDCCGALGRGLRRLRYDPRGYDRRHDLDPEFLCQVCSPRRLAEIERSLR